MIQKLKQIANGDVIVFDTSALSTSEENTVMAEIMEKGPRGFRSAPDGFIAERTRKVYDLYDFACTGKMVAVPEVLLEMRKGYARLNEKIEHFKLLRPKDKFQEKLDTRILATLSDYSEAYYGFLNEMSSKRCRFGFYNFDDQKRKALNQSAAYQDMRFQESLDEKMVSFFQKLLSEHEGDLQKARGADYHGKTKALINCYLPFFHMACCYSKKERKASLYSAQKKGRIGLGAALNTDARIAAAAYSLSFGNQVSILTRDSGIESLVNEVEFTLKNKPFSVRAYGLTSNPAFKMRILNPDTFMRQPVSVR